MKATISFLLHWRRAGLKKNHFLCTIATFFSEKRRRNTPSSNHAQLKRVIARHPALQELDLNTELNYFILDASFGDKWNILSLLSQHLALYSSSRIIAAFPDHSLIGIFVPVDLIHERFLFISQAQIRRVAKYFGPKSMLSAPIAAAHSMPGCAATVTSYFIKMGLPPSSIRHLHLVNYPYFNDLHNLYGISYASLQKIILYLPASARPQMPAFYTDEDLKLARAIANPQMVDSKESEAPAIVINTVNFSQATLSHKQLSHIIQIIIAKGYRVLLNTTQAPAQRRFTKLVDASPLITEIQIPAHLVALVFNQSHAVIGVLGGAMNVAVQFSNCHVLSLQTPALWTGCSEDELYGPWGKENIWKWVDQDWSCLHPNRIVENCFIGDPSLLPNEILGKVIDGFFEKLPHQNSL